MKRYLLFMWMQYYPGGGCYDLKGTFDTTEEAHAAINANKKESLMYDFGQIYDTKEGKVIYEY